MEVLTPQEAGHEIGKRLGGMAVPIVRLFQKLWPTLRYVIIGAVIVVATPPVTEYWLKHVTMPPVPIGSIVTMLVASLLLFAFAVAIWAVLMALGELRVGLPRHMTRMPRGTAAAQAPAATGGSFTPTTERVQWAAEQLDELQQMGVLDDQQIGERLREMLEGAARQK